MTTEKRPMPEHEQRCRELAELCSCGYPGDDHAGEYKLDTRFASLRGEHETYEANGWVVCAVCQWSELDAQPRAPYCLRTDGDALDEAIAACGYSAHVIKGNYEWLCELRRLGPDGDYAIDVEIEVSSYSPREAKSAALWTIIFNPLP